MVESGGLENRCTGNPGTEGSNPSPSVSYGRRRHAVGPHQQRGAAEDAERPRRHRVEPAGRDRRGAAARLPGRLAGAGEARQPVGEEVERRRAPRLAGQPGVGDAAAEVRAQLVGRAADRAARVGRARGVVLGDRPPLRLVGVEQRVAGPAAQHPGELPAEVVAVADRGVHPGRAARREAVRGVADQERAALAEAVGERDAVVGGGEALDLRLEVRDRRRRAGPRA